MSKEYVLIIGSMKSGTTTLFDLLAAHPEICASRLKEPAFFAYPEVWSKGPGWYNDLFDFDADVHRYGLEASTDYSKFPFADDVPERIKGFEGSQFKLIYIMRHPLRRLESHARHVQLSKKELGQRVSDIKDHSLEAGVSPVSMATAQYAAQISQYQEWFDRGHLLLLTFEELVTDQQGVVDKVTDFLQLSRETLETAQASNQAQNKRIVPDHVAAIKSIGAFTSVARAVVPKSLRQRINDGLWKKPVLKGRFKLTASEEKDLLAQLGPDITRLRTEYGVDTKRWWGLE